jgi:hypothetical protein
MSGLDPEEARDSRPTAVSGYSDFRLLASDSWFGMNEAEMSNKTGRIRKYVATNEGQDARYRHDGAARTEQAAFIRWSSCERTHWRLSLATALG